ncbi:MAG: PQQ-binding-like beta-propeller repeat protein [Planctomyces sp.]|nr:PQQ-binding-like beta-propeller repeat protein [Planctomyces sp.]
MRLLTAALCGCVLSWMLTPAAFAQDFESQRLANWHQWRGPDGNGVSPDGTPPVHWGPDRNIRWKTAIPGEGSASPIVWQDQIIVLTAVPTDRRPEGDASRRPPERGPGDGAPDNAFQFTVLSFDRNTGEVQWQRVAADVVPHESRHQTNTYASGSPTTDGEFIYASFGSQGVYCYDMRGELQWSRDLGKMQTRNGFGEGSSPTIHKGTLVVTWDHEGPSFITALNARTGEPKWKVDRDEPTTWATPFVVDHAGRTQVVTNGTNRVRSYDLDTGELIWECGGQATNPIPTPVLLDNLVYCMTGYRGYALYAIPLESRGDITGTDAVAWQRSDGTPYIASPILYRDILYVTQSREAILTTLNPRTGEVLSDRRRLPDLKVLYASPVAADGRLYYTDRDGTTLVLQHGPEPEVLATNHLGEVVDASPAIIGRQMFVRGAQHLYCIEETAGADQGR